MPILGVTLTSDLVLRIIVSEAYLLYSQFLENCIESGAYPLSSLK